MKTLLLLIKQIFISLKYKTKHRDTNIWIFGEWFGDNACDNSLYFANYICNTNSNIKCYWITNKNADLHRLDKKINIVEKDTKESKELFKKCGVVIMNQGFCDFSSSANNYFEGALSINLWHGVGGKKISFELLKQDPIHKILMKLYKKYLSANYFLAPSMEFEQQCQRAFFANDNNIIRAGQPRNELLFNESSNNKNEILQKMGLPLDTKIICYLPTFRNNSNPFYFACENHLEKILTDSNSIIIQKPHFSDKIDKDLSNGNRIYYSKDLSAQELLQISDILITDYSSCAYDFLIKDKPIIHYLYDYPSYISSERVLNYTIDELRCGDLCYTYDELLNSIKASISNEQKDSTLRKEKLKKFAERESHNNCEIIYNQIKNIIKDNY